MLNTGLSAFVSKQKKAAAIKIRIVLFISLGFLSCFFWQKYLFPLNTEKNLDKKNFQKISKESHNCLITNR